MCTFSTSQLPKVVRVWCALYILTSKCASRHNGVHFLDISISKSGPSMLCFVHFDFEMCFAPQRRALFGHLNFQKWSENGVFVHFDFEMCFAPQRRAIFHLLSGQPAPHPPLQRAYFSTLWRHKSLEKHNVSRRSYLFAHLHLLSSDSFSSLIFSLLLFSSLFFCSTSAFHLSILSEV